MCLDIFSRCDFLCKSEFRENSEGKVFSVVVVVAAFREVERKMAEKIKRTDEENVQPKWLVVFGQKIKFQNSFHLCLFFVFSLFLRSD